MKTPYPLGKLPPEHLARLLDRHAPTNKRVVLGPGIGHDAAVIAFCDGEAGSGRYLVAKTDPITFASDEIGWYAVHVNANDVACTGATPCWFLVTLLLPQQGTDEALVDEIYDQIARTCDQLDIALVGGHTEITHGLDRPVVAGFMLGEVAPTALVRPDGARPGDALLLTKGVAVEGTAIIAREKGDALMAGGNLPAGVTPALLERSRDFLHRPGISVIEDASIAVQAGDVHAMHDPTEGGLATGLWELAEAGEVGLVVEEDSIPIFEETALLCQALNLDPLGLIASGALLLAVADDDADHVQEALEEAGIAATHIGRVVERKQGKVLRSAGGQRPLPTFERDEIAQLFE
ncbi:MAG: AIR synthase family protein [Anaerolineae bacterium]|nr:AIR synthase family protein [Anaerolineae bacterium]